MPNLIAYNPSIPISNAIQFGTIVMDVNNSVNKGTLQWCTDYGICNQYFIIGDSYSLGKTTQSTAVPIGYPTSAKTDTSLLITLNKIAVSEGYNSFTTLSDAITWSASLGLFIENQAYPSIITTNQSLLLDAGYTASYPLVNSIWYDISGNENTGTINGATYNSANLGTLVFDGADSITFSSVNNIPVGSTPYTLNVWFNANTLGNKGLIGYGNYGSTNQVNAFRLTSGNLTNYWSGNDLSTTDSPITTNTWYNAVATWDGTTRKIYVNGVLKVQDTPGTPSTSVTSNLTVGLTNTTEYFDGKIGVVQVFPSALTQAQITQNYNAILPRYNGTYTDPCNSPVQCTPTNTPLITQSITPSPTPTPNNYQNCSSYDLNGGTTGTQFQYIICPTNDYVPVSIYVGANEVITNICVIDSYGVIAFNGDGYYTLVGNCSVAPTQTSTSTPPVTPTPTSTSYNCSQILVYPVYNDAYCTPTGDPSLIFAYNHPGNPVLYDNVYTTCSYTTIIPSGTYSNGTYVYNVSGGQIYNIQICAGIISPTPTATRTPTPTRQLIPPSPSATPPLPTPTETPACISIVEKVFESIDLQIAGCSPVLVNPTYGNYTGIFSKLRFVNGPVTNLIVYDLQGRELVNGTGVNYSNNFDFRDYNLPQGNYPISYRRCSQTTSTGAVVSWIPLGIGSQSTTAFSYTTATTGNQACFDYNIQRINSSTGGSLSNSRDLIFTITSTSSSGPISVGDTLQTGYTQSIGNYVTGSAPSGTYVIGNGNKYVVNSSSIVTSVDTTTCDSLGVPNFQSFNYNTTLPNTMYQVYFTGQYNSIPTVGQCYRFEQAGYTSTIQIVGKVASYSINGGVLNLANVSFNCNVVTLYGGTQGSRFQWTICDYASTVELDAWVFENTQISFCSEADSPIYMTAGDGSYFRFGYCSSVNWGSCRPYTNPFWTSYYYDTSTGLFGCNQSYGG
jgi:hypothetical protein